MSAHDDARNVQCAECGLFGGAHCETCSVAMENARQMAQRSAPTLAEYEAMRNAWKPTTTPAAGDV